MKSILSTLAVATLLVGGTTLAQETSSLPASDSPITATFYDDNPYGGGEALEGSAQGSVVSVNLNSATLGSNVSDSDDADFVLIEVGDGGLAFDIAGGGSPNSIQLQGVNDGESMTLAEVAEAMNAALNGDTNLAVFVDGDAVVTGFYTFAEGNVPNVDVDEAAYVVLTWDGQVNVFEATADPGARPLENVQVQTAEGQTVSLFNLSLAND